MILKFSIPNFSKYVKIEIQKVNTNGTPITNIQHGTFTRLIAKSITSGGGSANFTITFSSPFSVGSIPKVILCNSSSATFASIVALNYLTVSAQEVNINGFRLVITNLGGTSFNDFLNVDWIAYRDT
jgi:hypothetical protein